jgi:hypothetical protein
MESTQVSINGWMDKENVVYIHQYYSYTKKNEIMLFVGKWMEHEIIMLSKVNQTLKDKYCVFSSNTESISQKEKDMNI